MGEQVAGERGEHWYSRGFGRCTDFASPPVIHTDAQSLEFLINELINLIN